MNYLSPITLYMSNRGYLNITIYMEETRKKIGSRLYAMAVLYYIFTGVKRGVKNFFRFSKSGTHYK